MSINAKLGRVSIGPITHHFYISSDLGAFMVERASNDKHGRSAEAENIRMVGKLVAKLNEPHVMHTVRQERERMINILKQQEFTSLEHMPHEAAVLINAGNGTSKSSGLRAQVVEEASERDRAIFDCISVIGACKDRSMATLAPALHALREDVQVSSSAIKEHAEMVDLLTWVEERKLKVDPFDMPTGQGDADVGWRISQYVQDRSKHAGGERVIYEHFKDDLVEALRIAKALYEKEGG